MLECEFISGAANTVRCGAKWFTAPSVNINHDKRTKYIAYACTNLIMILNESTCRVVCSLKGHTKKVTCLSINLHTEHQCIEVVSGGDDGKLIVWRHHTILKEHGELTDWVKHDLFTMQTPVNAIHSTIINEHEYGTLVTASTMDGQVCTWLRLGLPTDETLFHLIDEFKTHAAQAPYCLLLDAIHADLDNTTDADQSIVLFCGCLDSKIYVRVGSYNEARNAVMMMREPELKGNAVFPAVLTLKGVLQGHEEWITSLSAVHLAASTVMLASGSKDSKIRLWRIVSTNTARAANVVVGLVSASAVSSQPISCDDVDVSLYVNSSLNGGDDGEDNDEGDATDRPEVDIDDDITNEARLNFKTTNIALKSSTFAKMTISSSGLVAPAAAAAGLGHVQHSVFLEALLVGHEDWVSSVSWMMSCALPLHRSTATATATAVTRHDEKHLWLYSTSMDRNMVIWSCSDQCAGGMWTPRVRIGDIGGQLGGSVGANLLGFVDGCVSDDYSSLLGVGYGGSLHLWKRVVDIDADAAALRNDDDDDDPGRWVPMPLATGHFSSVNDLAWGPEGEYLVTVSSDQTCRIFARCFATDADANADGDDVSASNSSSGRWREVSRPQIHGYDLVSVALMSHHPGARGLPQRLVTAGDEKLIRVFSPPGLVIEGVATLCRITPSQPPPHTNGSSSNSIDVTKSVYKAYIPELGLSNRASELMSTSEQLEMDSRNVSSADWRRAPLESQLTDYTVWPEERKVYGHNNDVVCMAVNASQTVLVTANKAKDRGSAKLLLWRLPSFEFVHSLDAHDSTVVTVRFSPDDKYFCSAGKDRSLCLYAAAAAGVTVTSIDDGGQQQQVQQEHQPHVKYDAVVIQKNAHKRIIWDCSWSSDSRSIITVSRDGAAKVWRLQITPTAAAAAAECVSAAAEYRLECVLTVAAPFEGGVAITSVDMNSFVTFASAAAVVEESADNQSTSAAAAAEVADTSCLVLLGAESGAIALWRLTQQQSSKSANVNVTMHHLSNLNECFSHGAAVKRVRWTGETTAASCGEDNTVRIFRVKSNSVK